MSCIPVQTDATGELLYFPAPKSMCLFLLILLSYKSILLLGPQSPPDNNQQHSAHTPATRGLDNKCIHFSKISPLGFSGFDEADDLSPSTNFPSLQTRLFQNQMNTSGDGFLGSPSAIGDG